MKNQKNIRIGRIMLKLDMENGKIQKISLHNRAQSNSGDAPDAIRKTASELNRGVNEETLSLSTDDLNLDILTPFQQKILLCLYENVPPGKVITYGTLAALAGHPGAARAAGTVMSTNPFPMLLPCHRVVPSNGQIGRFGSGPDMKKEILESEGVTFDDHGKIKSRHFIQLPE